MNVLEARAAVEMATTRLDKCQAAIAEIDATLDCLQHEVPKLVDELGAAQARAIIGLPSDPNECRRLLEVARDRLTELPAKRRALAAHLSDLRRTKSQAEEHLMVARQRLVKSLVDERKQEAVAAIRVALGKQARWLELCRYADLPTTGDYARHAFPAEDRSSIGELMQREALNDWSLCASLGRRYTDEEVLAMTAPDTQRDTVEPDLDVIHVTLDDEEALAPC